MRESGNELDLQELAAGNIQVAQAGRQQWTTYVIVVEFSRPRAEVQENVR